jgi:hypothetical protein
VPTHETMTRHRCCVSSCLDDTRIFIFFDMKVLGQSRTNLNVFHVISFNFMSNSCVTEKTYTNAHPCVIPGVNCKKPPHFGLWL